MIKLIMFRDYSGTGIFIEEGQFDQAIRGQQGKEIMQRIVKRREGERVVPIP